MGIVLALAATRLLAGMLVGVTPSDPTTYAAVAALLVAVALVGSWIPAGGLPASTRGLRCPASEPPSLLQALPPPPACPFAGA